MALLADLTADIKTQGPDHIVCTGDTCNIGLPGEWAASRDFLESLGSAKEVSFVPGNHDAYVPGALEGLLRQVGPWAQSHDGPSSDESKGVFPYIRRLSLHGGGSIAFIGLSSAVPTPPFVASGRLGTGQCMAVERLLADLRQDRSCFRIVLIHHPPHRDGARRGRGLIDAAAFEALIGRVGAELILHGHNHVTSIAYLQGPDGNVPVIGAPSASERGLGHAHRAGYHLFCIDRDETGFVLRAELRGLKPDGTIGHVGMLPLSYR